MAEARRKPAPKRAAPAKPAPKAASKRAEEPLPLTKGLISDSDKRLLVAGARQAAANDRARLEGKKAAAPGEKSREQQLLEENVALKAQLSKIKGIAVSMNSRSARISQVPGHVLADFSNQILGTINRAK